MKYHILIESGDKIASFVNEYDRDLCLGAFEDMFDDCVLTTEDDE